jgi:RNA polymerase sigma-70 factor (ECF subfamily)
MDEDRSRLLHTAAATGDDAAVEELLARYLPDLERYVAHNAGGFVLAHESRSDLVQSVCREVIVRLRDGRFSYRGEARFRQWLYRAAVMKMMNRHRFYRAARRDAGQVTPPADSPDVPAPGATPSEEAGLREDLDRFARAFARLPDNYRTIIQLHHADGRPHAEIARELGITEAHSRVLLSRALAKLASAV